MGEDSLSQLFRRLGAREPEQWARSEQLEGIPQLARFFFLRQAWRLVIAEDDVTWIRDRMAVDGREPGGSIGPALKRLLAADVSKQDLTTIVRVMQWELLFGFCYLLDDPGDLEAEAKDVAWKLYQIDEEGEPIQPIDGLHESVLETDPTQREMRPK